MVQYIINTGQEQMVPTIDRGRAMMRIIVVAPDWIQGCGPIFVDDAKSSSKQVRIPKRQQIITNPPTMIAIDDGASPVVFPDVGVSRIITGADIIPVNSANGCSAYIEGVAAAVKYWLTLIPKNPMQASPAAYGVGQIYIPADVTALRVTTDGVAVGSKLSSQTYGRMLAAYDEVAFEKGGQVHVRNQTGYTIIVEFMRVIPGD